ncbi:MAG: hypothetical protein ACRYGP_17460 [Janthinobacterium lividum]
MKRPIRTEAQILADERTRVDAILTSVEGARNPKLARELVLQGSTLAQATGILKLAPPENPYLAAMEIHGPTGVPAPSGVSVGPADLKAARMAEIKAAGAAFRGERAAGVR